MSISILLEKKNCYEVSKIIVNQQQQTYLSELYTDCATHLTLLQGKINIRVDTLNGQSETFNQVEIGEVFHIHPGERFYIENSEESEGSEESILLQVQIYTHTVSSNSSEPIDFTTMNLREFRLIGYTEQEPESDFIGDSNQNVEFKCKFC